MSGYHSKVAIQDGQFAITGGFAMRVYGSTRQTFDVDMCVKPEPGYAPLLRAMLQSPRITLPSSKFIGAVLRCYVETGPSIGDNTQTDRAVKMDIMINGFLLPRFTHHTMKLTTNAQKICVLDRQCLLKNGIREYKHRLDQEDVEYFIDEGLVPTESQATVQQTKRILMLTGPPSPSSA
ncbi:hypothetical protein HO133_002664 [Letharia lupina]|uniref:Uncharacterized protein n=1 Tax=Letharia lupina TaxID=560253 RepID=A0A8H6FAR4_9LECA|nr:uncharacterized protein HO133_002664 [Letharia lupina]KAF6220983.1 hypothetical protein HO133_002664 [Letharia lupina]